MTPEGRRHFEGTIGQDPEGWYYCRECDAPLPRRIDAEAHAERHAAEAAREADHE